MQITGFGRASLKVRDLETSARFYSQVLRMQVVRKSQCQGQLGLRIGKSSEFVLQSSDISAREVSSFPQLAFVIGNNPRTLEDAANHLAANGIPFEEVVHEEYESLYLRDPDGHLIELYYWPEW